MSDDLDDLDHLAYLARAGRAELAALAEPEPAGLAELASLPADAEALLLLASPQWASASRERAERRARGRAVFMVRRHTPKPRASSQRLDCGGYERLAAGLRLKHARRP